MFNERVFSRRSKGISMKKLSPMVLAAASLFAYAAVVIIVYLLAYGVLPSGSMWTVILLTGIVGALPLIVSFRYAGFIFYAGCILSFLIDAVAIHSLAPQESAMPDEGWIPIAVIAVGLVVGMAAEVTALHRRRTNSPENQENVQQEAIEEATDQEENIDFKKYDE